MNPEDFVQEERNALEKIAGESVRYHERKIRYLSADIENRLTPVRNSAAFLSLSVNF